MKTPIVCFRLVLALLVVCTLQLYSQGFTVINQAANRKIDPLLQQSLYLKEQFPRQAVTSIEYYAAGTRAAKDAGDFVGVLIESSSDVREYVRSLGGIVGSRHGNIYTALIPVNKVMQVAQDSRVNYIEASRRLFPSLDRSVPKTGADVLHALADPTKRLTGKGIILGFTDSGINTGHPNFKTPDGKTRILYVWDQYASSGGAPPAGFTYGIEKDSAAINAHTWFMEDGGLHGTHVSGIAAGNGLPSMQYVGMAPDADIIMVANRGDDLFNSGLTSVGTLDGYDYIRTKANALGRRFVINTSQGTNLGPHDGTTLFEKAINADVGAGSVLCLSAGNSASSNRHASAVVATSSSVEVECRFLSDTPFPIPMDIWYGENDRMTLRVKQSSDSSYVTLFPPVDSTITYSFDMVTISATTKIGSPLNGDNEIYITFAASTAGDMKLQFSASPGNTLPDGGRVDLWWERNYPVEFLTKVDPSITLGMPACADSAITVASHNNQSGNAGNEGDISTFSSLGPRRDGKMKPDLSGIGGLVTSSIGSIDYATFSGTSMSSPHVAGAVALLLQQDPSLTHSQVRQKLLTSATADMFTGDVPNPTWGYGKLNVLKAAGYKGIAIINAIPDTLNFGSLVIHLEKKDSVVVKNLGNEALTISAITASHAIFSADRTAFVVPPHSQEKLFILVTPIDTGDFSGSLEIISNDSLRPSVRITLLGRGDFVPEATVSPDSLSFTVNEGESANTPLTITNAGAGPLNYEITVAYSFPNQAGQSPSLATLTQQWGSPSGPTMSFPSITSQFATTSLLPLIVKDPIGDAFGVDVSEIRGKVERDTLTLQFVLATPLDPMDFAGYLGLDTDRNAATGSTLPFGAPGQDVGCEFFVALFDLTSGIVLYDSLWSFHGVFPAVLDLAGKSFTFSIPLHTLGNDDGLMNLAAIVGTAFGPTDHVPDAGHGSVGIAWLSTIPDAGIVFPESAIPVSVQIATSDLDGGDFSATLTVATNDPNKKTINIPVRLTVLGTPNLVAPDSITFNTVYIGYPDTVAVLLRNNGSDNLSITSISVNDPRFEVLGSTNFALAKDQTDTVHLVCNPPATGSVNAELSIASNDPGTPIAVVLITGVAAHPPVIALSPDSISVSILENDSTVRELTISNNGLGELRWTFSQFEEPDGPASALGDGFTSRKGTNEKHSVRRGFENTLSDAERLGVADASEIRNRSAKQVNTESTVGSATSGKILIWSGESNLPYWGTLRATLESAGFSVFLYAYLPTLQPTGSYAAVFISEPPNPLSSSEISELRNYALAGGRIIDMTDSFVENINPFLIEFGVTRSGGGAAGPVHSTHQLFVGVGDLTLDGNNWDNQLTVVSPSNPVATCAEQVISSIASNDGLLVFGEDSHFSDFVNSLADPDNIRLLQNVITWIKTGSRMVIPSPVSGIVGPGGSQAVALAISAKNLRGGGDYRTSLVIQNNDPLHPSLELPLNLHVIGVPVIAVEPDSMVNIIAYVGVQRKDTLHVKNIGTEGLTVNNVTVSDTAFKISKTTFSVPPDGEEILLITFTPQDTGVFGGEVTVESNDERRPTMLFVLRGRAFYPPVLTTSPDSFVVTIDQEDSSTRMLTLGNAGLGELHWEIQQFASTTMGEPAHGRDYESLFAPGSRWQRTDGKSDPKNIQPAVAQYPTSVKSSTPAKIGGPTREVLPFPLFGTNGGGIQTIDPTTGAITRLFPLQLSDGPDGLAFDGVWLYVLLGFSNQVYRMSAYDGTIVDTIVLSFASSIDGLAVNGNLLYVLDYGLSRIYAVDLATKSLVATVYPGVPVGGGITYAAGRNTLFVSNFSNAIYELEGASGGIVRQFPPPDGVNVYGVAYSNSADVLIVSGSGYTYLLDPNTGAVLSSFEGWYTGLAADETASPFVTLNPNSGVIPPQGSQEVTVQIHARNMTAGQYPFALRIISNDPLRNPQDIPVNLTVQVPVGVNDGPTSLPKVFALHQNYPNPFNPTTKIQFDIPNTSRVTLEVYNILGQHLVTLVDGEQTGGYYSAEWNGHVNDNPAGSGVYFARIRAGDFVKTLKMVLMK